MHFAFFTASACLKHFILHGLKYFKLFTTGFADVIVGWHDDNKTTAYEKRRPLWRVFASPQTQLAYIQGILSRPAPLPIMDFKQHLQFYVQRTEAGLRQFTPAPDTRPARIHEAMRYTLEAGGKRLRPVLALAACDLFGAKHDALPAAVALECIHTYSLVHDDLPCMDNDDLRRGRPTAHKAFDEATALLAGDGLLTHAFFILSFQYASTPSLANALVLELSDTAGSQRLIGGQMADLLGERQQTPSAEELNFIHLNKTAAMLEASLVMGGLCGGATLEQLETLRLAGRHSGLAFQVIDDILDVTADTSTLGKTAGKDQATDKTTFVKIHGLKRAREIAAELTLQASEALLSLPGDSSFLRELITDMGRRVK